jgi:hypothetical protein
MSKGRPDAEQASLSVGAPVKAPAGAAPAKVPAGDAPAKAPAKTAQAPGVGRGERLSAALRANLARRKAQARERKGSQMGPHEGNPDDAGALGTREGSHDSAGFVGDKRTR